MSALLMRWQDEQVIKLEPAVRLALADETILELSPQKKLFVYENQSRRSFSPGQIFKVQNQFFALLDTSAPLSLIIPANKDQFFDTLPRLHQHFFSFVHSSFNELSRKSASCTKAMFWDAIVHLRNLIAAVFLMSLAWQGLNTDSRIEAPPLGNDEARQTSKTRMYATVALLEKQLEAQEKLDDSATANASNAAQNVSKQEAANLNNISNSPSDKATFLASAGKISLKGAVRKASCASQVLDPDELRFLPRAEKLRLMRLNRKAQKECKP